MLSKYQAPCSSDSCLPSIQVLVPQTLGELLIAAGTNFVVSLPVCKHLLILFCDAFES